MDIFTKKKRSEIMSKIRGKNTKIELLIFRELRRKKIYFQKHYKKIPGSPDVAIPSKKIAVFIDGDFWHGYGFKKRRKLLPKVYWRAKIEQNIRRDERNRRVLRKRGWRVLRIWEHQVNKDFDKTIMKISNFILNF